MCAVNMKESESLITKMGVEYIHFIHKMHQSREITLECFRTEPHMSSSIYPRTHIYVVNFNDNIHYYV